MSKKTYREEGEKGLLCPKCGDNNLRAFFAVEYLYKHQNHGFRFNHYHYRDLIPLDSVTPELEAWCVECKEAFSIRDAAERFEELPARSKGNVGDLDGMMCPECGSLEPFRIDQRSVMMVNDDGMKNYFTVQPEWDLDSYCRCDKCEFSGVARDFLAKENKNGQKDL